jgi:hypothetical protein
MIISPLDIYIDTVQSNNSTTPAMMSEKNIFTLITKITSEHIMSFEELNEINSTNIFVYDIPDDKKEFNIETVRRCIMDIELKPYEWKNLYILRHFSTATIQAQNALLKILEECPIHAVILLEIDNPNSILETIRSRIINLTGQNELHEIDIIWQEIIWFYKNKEHKKLAQALYGLKCTSNEAIKILQWVYPYLWADDMKRCDYAIESLSLTHESPKSILDIFFL